MPLMEVFVQKNGPSRYVFLPLPGNHGEIFSAVSICADGTTRLEISGQKKSELNEKAAVIEQALGSCARQDITQSDGSLSCVFTTATALDNLSDLIPQNELDTVKVEAIRRGLIAAPAAKSAKKSDDDTSLSISFARLSDQLPA